MFILYFIGIADGSSIIIGKFFEIGINSSVSILGFLIAGFAIYSTFIDKELLYFLITFKDNEESLNKFQANYLEFLKPLLYFIVLFILSFIGLIISSSWSSFKNIIENFTRTSKGLMIFNFSITVIISTYLTYVLFCILSLIDFVYNIYAVAKVIGWYELCKKQYNFEPDNLINIINKQEQKKGNE